MPILDLVTPWAAAARSGDSRDGEQFLTRSADVLEPVRRQRAAAEVRLPPPTDWARLPELAADGGLHQVLRDARDRLIDRGLVEPKRIVLLASAAPGGPVEVIPEPGAETIVLFVDRMVGARHASPASTHATHASALAAGMAALTRWTTPENPVAAVAARGSWDRWAAAREVPLAEWIYAAGIGVHAALELGDVPAAALGIGDGDLRRLRQAERALQARLDADLDGTGMGLLLRWLEDDAPATMRRAPDGTLIPPAAGRYLGWRMLADRVARVGLAEAVRMTA